MNSLYWIFTALLLLRVECNPVTQLSDNESTVPMAEVSVTTESVTNSAEDIDSSAEDELVINTEESLSVTDCSHCLNSKYLNHYYAKGCQPTYDEGCKDCPKSFDCNQSEEVNVGGDECLYNGIKYRVGEAVPVDNPCKVCQCGYGFTHAVPYSTPFTTIHCITVECPEHFAVHRFPLLGFQKEFEDSKNCYNIYVRSECCAVDKRCIESGVETNEKVCEYNEKKYRIGEKIYPIEDKCKVCICDQHWNHNSTINNSGCYDVKCNLEVDRQLREGCIPIYNENTCCPLDFYCPEREFEADIAKCSDNPDSGPCVGQFKRFYYNLRDNQCHSFVYGGCGGNDNNFRSEEECRQTCSKYNTQGETEDKSVDSTDGSNYCLVNDIKYEVGAKLDIGHKCVDCECRIPPDFTCIQKSCPTLPSIDCKVTVSPSECCPIFDCNYNKTNERPFDPLRCPTPMCQKGCLFETYPDKCPDCVCPPSNKDQELPEYDLSDV